MKRKLLATIISTVVVASSLWIGQDVVSAEDTNPGVEPIYVKEHSCNEDI